MNMYDPAGRITKEMKKQDKYIQHLYLYKEIRNKFVIR